MAKKVSKGFGDTIAKFTEATGIDKVVHFIAGNDCNCKARQEVLNKMFPYKTPECLTEVEHKQLTYLLPKMTVRVRPSEQLQFLEVYNRVFKTNEQPTSCASCLNDMLRKMKQVYNAYENEGALLG